MLKEFVKCREFSGDRSPFFRRSGPKTDVELNGIDAGAERQIFTARFG